MSNRYLVNAITIDKFQKTAAEIDAENVKKCLKDLVNLVGEYTNYGVDQLFEERIEAVTTAVRRIL